MRGKLSYFTPAEFITLLDLAGDGPYSAARGGFPEPDDGQIRLALASLFNRGLLVRTAWGLTLGPAGQPFSAMRSAQDVVLIRDPTESRCAAACYLAGNVLWLTELVNNVLALCYRVWQLAPGEAGDWLLDSGLLEPPLLTQDDTPELEDLFQDVLEEPCGRTILRLERYRNGGALQFVYEVRACKGAPVVVRWEGMDIRTEFYTKEALSAMLAECFGKESNDYCQCEGTGTGKGI